jgi:hypothetical protein
MTPKYYGIDKLDIPITASGLSKLIEKVTLYYYDSD